jgi:hypothetical protein
MGVDMAPLIRRGGQTCPGIRFGVWRLASLYIVVLVVQVGLSGCTLRDVSLPKGMYLPACAYGIETQSQPVRCRSKAEYQAARERARIEQATGARVGDKPVDPRYEEWIP